MDELIYYNELYDLYKNLLTEKQRQYFEDYYFNNLSLSEMSNNLLISRNAISKQLSTIRDKLCDYEKKLQLYSKTRKILKVIKNEELQNKIVDILLS